MKSGVGEHSNAPYPSRDTRTHWSRNSFIFPSPVSVILSNLTHSIYINENIRKFDITYLLIYLLTPWSRVRLEKLTGFQLVKKFGPPFYGTRRLTF